MHFETTPANTLIERIDNMKLKLMLLSAIALSAGCSGGGSQPAAAAADATTAPAAAAPATIAPPAVATPAAPATPAEKSLYSRLPDPAIRLPFAFEFKGDKTVQAANGTSRRGLAIGYSGMDAGQVWSGIETGLTAAGFRAAPRKADADGKGSQLYLKSGMPNLTFSVAPGGASEGKVWIGWQADADIAQGS
jgi:hypothetical protein